MDRVERVARAIWTAVCIQADEIGMPRVSKDTFDDLHSEDRARQLRIARAAIDAADAP